MSFIDDSEKNVDKLFETSAVGGGGIPGFVGRAGMEIDKIFAGGFHPDSGHGSKNLELLKKQVKDRQELRKDMEDQAYEDGVELIGNPAPIGGYYADFVTTELIDLAYEELMNTNERNNKYNAENTPEQDIKWTPVKTNLKYDKAPDYAGQNFINKSTTNWEYITKEVKPDDSDNVTEEDTIEEEENFINRSATNWQYIK
jgi:hypothetical protein